MQTNTTSNTPTLDAVVIATEQRNALWKHYEAWGRSATAEELQQLQSALEHFSTMEVQSLVTVIQRVLQDETERRMFPASFLAPLTDANWPAAQASC